EPQQRGGNLYNWTTATLGSGVDLSSGEATASICPAHWQLPNNDGTRSIINLLVTYYGESARGQTGNPQTGTATEPSALAQMQNLLRSEPISMVVSGRYNRSSGTWSGRTTAGGYVWSSTAGSAAIAAHGLDTSPSYFNPQNSYYRGGGLTVRCVSR
ncbi:MAG: hypothetical protein Q4F60_02090, partial [Candidatus Saccharibacteria bacterium]|nr:hypothetical protein [Candidatus Saccharibacteria bacterium]